MRLFLLTSTDTEFNIMFNLSFVVSNGVPSKIKCVDVDNTNLFPAYQTRRNQVPQLLREVIRSHYINISHPDMTRVVVKVTLAMREPQIFTCTVYVEGRVNITSDSYFYKQMGNASIIANITGECVHDCCMHSICMKLHLFPQLLANQPTSMSARLVYPALGSPGLPLHHHQLVMKCFIRLMAEGTE